ncbi:MAG TPA: hypothetical protein VGH27_15620 [Streptosporangiaceae bacterium]
MARAVADPDKTIEQGAVLPWTSGGRRLSMYAAGELVVRLGVPYKSLTDQERDQASDWSSPESGDAGSPAPRAP